MSALPEHRITPEEYLAIERAAEYKSWYYDGRMYPMDGQEQGMAGASFKHGLIIANLAAELTLALRKGPCVVVTNDLKVRVAPGGLYTYPDIVVACDKIEFADEREDTLLNPILLIEVLSKSTEAIDRGFKFAQYRQLASLKEYALVSQTEPRIEIFSRRPDGWVLSDYVGLDATCPFESVGCGIGLTDVYSKVTF